MKKMMFLATMVAAMIVCVPANAQSRKDKKAAAKAQWELEQKQKQEEAALLHQMKMDSLRNAQKQREEAAAREQALKDLKYETELASAQTKKNMKAQLMGVQLLYTPCMDEFIELNGVEGQIAAQGIATGQPTMEMAQHNANERAIDDIASRFAGVLKNGMENYTKDTSVPSSKRVTEGQMETMASSIGKKEINKLLVVKCRQFARDDYNQHVCYEACYIPAEKLIDAVVDEAAVRGVDVDKALFRKHMEEELKANQRAEQESLEQQRAAME